MMLKKYDWFEKKMKKKAIESTKFIRFESVF